MGAVTIRKISEEIKQAMRQEAAANGRSVEAELRALIEATYGKRRSGGRQPGESSMNYLLRIAPVDGPFDLPERDNLPPQAPDW